MTPECAADIRAEIDDIRNRIPVISAQVWEHTGSDGEQDKAEVLRDLEECCAIAEVALIRAGHPPEAPR